MEARENIRRLYYCVNLHATFRNRITKGILRACIPVADFVMEQIRTFVIRALDARVCPWIWTKKFFLPLLKTEQKNIQSSLIPEFTCWHGACTVGITNNYTSQTRTGNIDTRCPKSRKSVLLRISPTCHPPLLWRNRSRWRKESRGDAGNGTFPHHLTEYNICTYLHILLHIIIISMVENIRNDK